MSKRIISIILTILLFVMIGTQNTFAAANDDDLGAAQVGSGVDLASVSGNGFNPDSQSVEDYLIAQAADLPDSIDLRDYNGLNYVTPVKFQNPFGTCWAFGVVAASEISYLYDNGYGVPAGEVNNGIDFSEKHIAWYMYHPITEDDVMLGGVRASQVGEGIDPSQGESANINAVYNFGGLASYASNFFASGNGPVLEYFPVDGSYPYYYAGKNRWRLNDRNETPEMAALRKAFFKEAYRYNVDEYIEDGYIESADEYDEWFDENWGEGFFLYARSFKRSNYAGYDDWSLPLNADYRFPGLASYFKNSYILPDIARIDDDDNYEFKPAGLAAIKLELSKGHGVAIGFYADQSAPGDEIGDEGYLNTTNWAQYTNEYLVADHAVTIVGYDDNYPKENFTRKVRGEVVEGSTPPGDGAFIVKNSWGALTEEDKATVTYDVDGNPVYVSPNADDWGYESSGYFYLSYYDQTICEAESFEFYKTSEVKYLELNYDQYDLLQGSFYDSFSFPQELKMANVFDAEEDEYLCQISYMTTSPMATVHYALYKGVENGDPTSGVLLEEGENVHLLGGYQRIDLQKEYFLSKGETYSVVIQEITEEDDVTKNDVVFAYAVEIADMATSNGVVNPGESYLLTDGKWVDFSSDEVRSYWIDLIYQDNLNNLSEEDFAYLLPNGRDSIAMDNFAIKAFLVPARVKGLDYLLGDADGDNEITILDATAVQRHLASLEQLFGIQVFLADADRDGEVTILDATAIQRWLVNLPCPDGIGVTILPEKQDSSGA